MDLRIKKCLYLLFAFRTRTTVDFLKKHRSFTGKRAVSLKRLVQKIPSFFLKHKSPAGKPETIWQVFLKKTSYEEACVVAFTVAGYSVKDLSWILNLPPEVLAFRLKRGSLILGEEVLKKQKPPSSSGNVTEDNKLQRAKEYCKELKNMPLPVDLEQMVFKPRVSVSYFLILVVVAGLALTGWILKKVLSTKRPLILYQAPL